MKILGIVKWTNTDKGGHPIAGIQPLYEIEKTDWRQIDAAEEFPKQGQVFWPSARAAVENALVFFRAEANPGQKDEYKAADPQLAIDILDFRAFGGPTEVRAALEKGIRRPGLFVGRVLAWCNPNLLVGPISLMRTPTGLVKLETSNLAKVPTFQAVEPKHIYDGRQERLLRTDDAPPIGYVDWDDDSTILKRALQAAVRLAKQAGKDTGQTKRQIEEAAEALAAQGTGPEAQLDLYRLERARALSANSDLVAKLGPDLVDALRTHPIIAARLHLLEGQVRREVEQVARAAIEQTLAKEHEALRDVSLARERTQRDLAAEELNLKAVRNETENLRQRASAVAEEVDAAVNKRVRSALEHPAELLAEVSVLRPLVVQPQHVIAPYSGTRNGGAPKLRWSRDPGEVIGDRAALQRALVTTAKARGVAPASMLQLHAAVAAGLVPVVMGAGAIPGLVAYAHAVCGARLAVLHVSPGFVQAHDLLGTTDGNTFEPHQAGLLSAGSAAKEIEGASLVVLEGANRSPLECCLLPVLQMRAAGLPQIVPQFEEPVQLPSNLRIAATLVAGATTVPVSPQLWAYAVAFELDAVPIIPGATQATELPLASELFAPGDVPSDAVESLVEAWPGSNEVRPALERFGAALSRLYTDGPRIRSALLEGIVLPFLVSCTDDDEQEDAVNKLVDADASALTALAKRLHRRLR
jgi:hypothetical protein